MIRRQYLVSGRVQGVGYRAFVHAQARSLGFTGQVRNLDDGRVEVMVKGLIDQLSALEAMLRRGPTHAMVSGVDVFEVSGLLEWLEALEEFAVVEDGDTPWRIS